MSQICGAASAAKIKSLRLLERLGQARRGRAVARTCEQRGASGMITLSVFTIKSRATWHVESCQVEPNTRSPTAVLPHRVVLALRPPRFAATSAIHPARAPSSTRACPLGSNGTQRGARAPSYVHAWAPAAVYVHSGRCRGMSGGVWASKSDRPIFFYLSRLWRGGLNLCSAVTSKCHLETQMSP